MPEYGLYNGAWTGPEIDAAIGRSARISNPNLFDNWFFFGSQFPINQRGYASYTGTSSQVYCIDRWLFQGQYGSLAVGTDGIRWKTTSETGANILLQLIENPTAFVGKTVTVSVKASNSFDSVSVFIETANTEYIKSITIGNVSFQVRLYADTTNGYLRFYFRKDTAIFDVTIEAIKLELGDTQSLAHQEGTTWVLNEIPNYGEQFERCVTSRADSADTYANQAPESMRGFVPLIYEGTLPASGGAVDQQMFNGYKEYYLLDIQYLNTNGSTYGLSDSAFSATPFVQYTKGSVGTSCRIRFTINSNSSYNGRPYYVMVLAR